MLNDCRFGYQINVYTSIVICELRMEKGGAAAAVYKTHNNCELRMFRTCAVCTFECTLSYLYQSSCDNTIYKRIDNTRNDTLQKLKTQKNSHIGKNLES